MPYDPESLKYMLSELLQKKFADPCCRERRKYSEDLNPVSDLPPNVFLGKSLNISKSSFSNLKLKLMVNIHR